MARQLPSNPLRQHDATSGTAPAGRTTLSVQPSLSARSWQLNGAVVEDGPVQMIPIERCPFTIGRRSGNLLCLRFPSVSSRHAELCDGPDMLFVRDLNSTNGTFLNGFRVQGVRPVAEGDLLHFGGAAFRITSNAASLSVGTQLANVADDALALVQFEKLMAERSVLPHLQPIVELATSRTTAYEVLARSRLFGLGTPAAMFHAAARLDREAELSRLMRWEGVAATAEMRDPVEIYLNTHPLELGRPALVESLAAMRRQWPEQRLLLEIHEAAVTEPSVLRELRAALKDLAIGLAYDDFGAGQSRLMELSEVRPDVLKFDLSLVRDIHAANAARQQLLESLVSMARDLGVTPLAEGVELADEAATCRQLGFELAQGFHYGKPAPVRAWSNEPTS